MMHIVDDLPRLLTGDATRAEVLAAAEHLRGCAECGEELVSAVLAHAALMSARRFAADVVTRQPSTDDVPATGALPDLSAVFDQARADAARRPGKAPRRRRVRRTILAAVAAAAVVAGGAVAIVQTTGSSPSVSASRSIPLEPFGVGRHAATATLTGTTMRVQAAALPRLDGRHFYELWLTDAARTRMQSLGALGPGNQATLTVAPKVWNQYSAIEVSVQPVDQGAYSGTSVLRGSYQ